LKHLFENWKTFLKEESIPVPDVLYHATYRDLVDSIQKSGLGGKRLTNWSGSREGVVYLHIDPDAAYSYAETADEEDEKEVVVYKVNTAELDAELFQLDREILDNQGESWEYHSIIPFEKLVEIE
tara:strand:- start:609 stop:983 length:375 start_codon:yes stop_codon:yes gene_type:complete